MAPRKRNTSPAGALIRKLRKPMAPPAKVEKELTKYSRAREREKIRRRGD